jgi:hypothetical protein
LTNIASAFATCAIAFNVVANARADGAAEKLPATAENVLAAWLVLISQRSSGT